MASLNPRTGVLGKRLAAHLLRRATLGATRKEIDEFATKTAEEALTQLMNFPPLPDHPVDPKTGETWLISGQTPANSSNDELKFIANSWWLHHALSPANGLNAFAKVTFFLHTSFSTSFKDLDRSEDHYYTLRLFMHFATGSYKDLALKICLDNGMNDYLDIGESIKGNPNENFAREFFELFTIGKGPQIGDGDYTNYTEDDIRAAARLLTGFRKNTDWDDPLYIDVETGLPAATPMIERHDVEDKAFSPAFNNTIITGRATQETMVDEIRDLVDMIFNQPATAVTICRRMYRQFVKTTISEEAENDIIQPLAATLRNNNYQVVPVLRQLMTSQHFYDEDNDNNADEVIGALIKSPMDLQTNIIRYFQVPIPDPAVDAFESYVTFFRWGVQKRLSDACFDLFAPPDVAGYEPVFQAPDFNRLWISSKSIPARYVLADEHLDGGEIMQMDVMAFVENTENITDYDGMDPNGIMGPHQGARIAQHLLSELLSYLLPEEVSADRFDYFLNSILLDDLSELNWANEWDMYKGTGDDSAIKPQLKKLVRAIIQSPEFQIG
ncbi:MAG: DUF1800 family protein [Bacteroidota bacterium]